MDIYVNTSPLYATPRDNSHHDHVRVQKHGRVVIEVVSYRGEVLNIFRLVAF